MYHNNRAVGVKNKIRGVLEAHSIAKTVCMSRLPRLARKCFHGEVLEQQTPQHVVIAVGDRAH
jgi:hypothetical protein